MLLKGRDGSEFEATIVGYEFPHIEHKKWDSNWLMVSMRVQSPLGAGKCVDPCLTTWDVERLITWLEAQAQASPTESDIYFLEANLGFEICKVSGSVLTLRVHFILERGAFWKPVNGKRYRRSTWKSFVDLEISREDMQTAADAWRADLRTFPLREWS
jgi:hypothetical protein